MKAETPIEICGHPDNLQVAWLYKNWSASEFTTDYLKHFYLTGANIRKCFQLNPNFLK